MGAIHGRINEGTKKLGSLVVFSFQFSPEKRNIRIKSVNISIEFYGDDGHPAVSAMVPDGEVKAVS